MWEVVDRLVEPSLERKVCDHGGGEPAELMKLSPKDRWVSEEGREGS